MQIPVQNQSTATTIHAATRVRSRAGASVSQQDLLSRSPARKHPPERISGADGSGLRLVVQGMFLESQRGEAAESQSELKQTFEVGPAVHHDTYLYAHPKQLAPRCWSDIYRPKALALKDLGEAPPPGQPFPGPINQHSHPSEIYPNLALGIASRHVKTALRSMGSCSIPPRFQGSCVIGSVRICSCLKVGGYIAEAGTKNNGGPMQRNMGLIEEAACFCDDVHGSLGISFPTGNKIGPGGAVMTLRGLQWNSTSRRSANQIWLTCETLLMSSRATASPIMGEADILHRAPPGSLMITIQRQTLDNPNKVCGRWFLGAWIPRSKTKAPGLWPQAPEPTSTWGLGFRETLNPKP